MSSKYIILDENNDPNAHVWRVTEWDEESNDIGHRSGPVVTFDRENVWPVYHLFSDFPSKFTAEQIQILKEEKPFWYDFFSGRLK